MFSEYHYMDKKINNANRFFVAWWRAHPVGCVAATGFPGAVSNKSLTRHTSQFTIFRYSQRQVTRDT